LKDEDLELLPALSDVTANNVKVRSIIQKYFINLSGLRRFSRKYEGKPKELRKALTDHVHRWLKIQNIDDPSLLKRDALILYLSATNPI
jgi:hypothetical protein